MYMDKVSISHQQYKSRTISCVALPQLMKSIEHLVQRCLGYRSDDVLKLVRVVIQVCGAVEPNQLLEAVDRRKC